MNAYNFTNTNYIKETIAVDVRHYAMDMNYTSIRKSAEYEECEDTFIEVTMSCNHEERKNWMKFFMINAIAYGRQSRNADWQPKFLAAYDIYLGLLESEKRMVTTC